MKLKYLVALLMVNLASGQNPAMSCHPSMVDDEYTANVFISFNVPPFDSFPNCEMVHHVGRHDDDVRRIIITGSSANIPTAVCRTFPGARRIDASSIQLSQLMNFLHCGNVVRMNLSNNNVKEIFPNAFANMPNLVELDLSYNHIEDTHSLSLMNLHDLEVLNLSHNPEIPLADRFFQYLTSLKQLDISFSSIAALKNPWFYNLTRLIELNISNNPLTGIPAPAFAPLVNLQRLDMSSCTITELSAQTFNQNSNLVHLDMRSNAFRSLESSLLRSQTSLITLLLSNNRFEPLPGDFFQSLVNLRTLEMNNCDLVNLTVSWFATLAEVRVLSLAGNSIQRIPFKTFGVKNHLEELYMQNNKLEVLDATSFGNLGSLKELRVDYNNIRAVDSHFIEQPELLDRAYFAENQCVNENFDEFYLSRAENLAKFSGCFHNFDKIPIITETSPEESYRWYSMRWDTLVMHVKARENVTLFLSQFPNEEYGPSLKIQIGMGRNYYVWIFENETMHWEDKIESIISEHEWKSFVISWHAGVLQFYERHLQLPSAIHIITSPFPIDFFGVRADTRALFQITRIDENFEHAEFPEVDADFTLAPTVSTSPPASTAPTPPDTTTTDTNISTSTTSVPI